MHPILDSLNATQHEWLTKLLYAFNEGSIGKFEALAPIFASEVSCPSFGIEGLFRPLLSAYPPTKYAIPPRKNLFDGSH